MRMDPRDMAGASRRIPTLDGWRGMAILLVLFDHIQDSLLRQYIRPWTRTGLHGVTIFFVLSGFLITTKLIEGPIDLRDFYLRRFFRLMPAAWIFLATLFLVSKWIDFPLTSVREVVSCLLFYRNSLNISNGLAGHFWSLSIEEQFYFVWPCILLLAGRMRSIWIATAGTIGCAAYRFLTWSHYDRGMAYTRTQMHVDALLVGCLLALLLKNESRRKAAKGLSKWLAIPSLGILALCVAKYHVLMPLSECVAISILVTFTIFHPFTRVSQFLSLAPLAWLGTISYSVYLWQEAFMGFRNGYVIALGLPLCALGSYYLIERPTTRLGHRLTSARAEAT